MPETALTTPAPPRPAWAAVVSRLPATLTFVFALLLCGVVWQGLWVPFRHNPAFESVAYGLPAFESGRWWTPITGTFFVLKPWFYVPAILALWGFAMVEYLRGWKRALAYFWGGQIVSVVATGALLYVLSFIPNWEWVDHVSTLLDVGPSGGAFACMAAAAGLLPSPWRVRVWIVLIAAVTVGVFIVGSIADLTHAMALYLVLLVDRSLRVRRTTVREQRMIAFVGVLAFGVFEILVILVPTSGPFGGSDPLSGPLWTTAIDVLMVLLVADGLRRARRWAWIVAIVVLALDVLVAIVFAILLSVAGTFGNRGTDLALDISTGVLASLLLIYLIRVGGAFQWRRRGLLGLEPQPTQDEVKVALNTHGGGNLSWMATWEGNEYARTSTGIVAYQRRANAAIVLADPIGPESGRAASASEFITMAENAGLTPCFFSASEATRAAVPASWRSLVVADDTVVDLPDLAFTGKRWNSVRTSINRAGREEIEFRMAHLHDLPRNIRAQLQHISEAWVGDKGLPEMRFTLGTLEEAADPEVRIALAVTQHGEVEGFLSWLPVHGPDGVRGWTLDLMRRRDDGIFPSVMEYLIGMSATHFRDEGAATMSLSGAPLAHDYPADAKAISDLSNWLSNLLEPVYGFQSLHRFKQKFHPRYETLYLLFRDEGDLPRIGAGLTRAFLPDATLRQFAGAGRELLQRTPAGSEK